MTQELIRNRLKQVEAALQGISGVHVQDIRDFINGTISVTKQGHLKLPLALPAEEVLLYERDVRQVLNGEWKTLPLLMFVSSESAETEGSDAAAEAKQDPTAALPEDYSLVLLETDADYREEGMRMHNALASYYSLFTKQGIIAYSLRYRGHSILSLSVKPDRYAEHIVGPSNRPPTPQELEVLKQFVEPRGITIRYNQRAPY